MTAPALETETCGRCGGSGRHSYNQIDGDRCYGCGGKGISYTKRGAVAHAFLETLRKVRADSIKVGDVVQALALGGSYFARVVEAGPSSTASYYRGAERIPYLEIVTEHPRFGRVGLNTFPHASIRKGFTKGEKAAQLARALEFQATLTKAGKPRK